MLRPLSLSSMGVVTLLGGFLTGCANLSGGNPLREIPVPIENQISHVSDETDSVPTPPKPSSSSSTTPGKVHEVWIWQESGDSLWSLAQEHYGNPYLWPRIYEANRHILKNPHVIYPKQKILIPALDD